MSIVLHPRIATGNRLRVWVGAFHLTAPPVLHWKLDGHRRTPCTLAPIQSARSSAMVQANEPRAFTGVYEFQGSCVQPGTAHSVEVSAPATGGTPKTAKVMVRTLPSEVPRGISKSFNVLMVSCFHRAMDRQGFAGNVIAKIATSEQFRPDMTLLLGDQVYLDLPTFGVSGSLCGLAKKFERDYRLNWSGHNGYAQILRVAPSVSIPDDHEYWNNYPHGTPWVPETWTAGGRDAWKLAAERMYEAFQLPRPGALGDPIEFDVPPLSFFLMDTRSSRDSRRQFAQSPNSLKRFRIWVRRVAKSDPRLFGIIASGQPLLHKAAGILSGSTFDYALPNYGDYSVIANELSRLADGGRRFLLVTGDVHWGRVTQGTDRRILGGCRAGFYEVISSPASLVQTIGMDDVRNLLAGAKSIFGSSDPFPRHGEAKDPPHFFAPKTLGTRFKCTSLHSHKGNQMVLLSFRRDGFGLELRVYFWTIYPRFQVQHPQCVGPVKLFAV